MSGSFSGNLTTKENCKGNGGICKNVCPADTFQKGTCGLASICCVPTDINTTNKDKACQADGGICRRVCWPYEIDTGMCRFSRCCVSSDVPDLLAALSLQHVQAAVLIRGFVQPSFNCQARAQDIITAFAALVSLTNAFIAKRLEEVECRLMPACDNHFGECRKQCHSFERVVAGGCGRHCTCCTSRPAVCPATHDTCAANSTLQDICTTKGGTCRKTCSPSEKSYVTCGSNLGHCCIPIVGNITTTAQCTGRGGMCKNMTLCPTDTLQNGRCGLTFICCFPTDKCRLMPACDNHFGECRKQCYSFERPVAGGCGRHCTCCTSRPAVCPATHDTCAANSTLQDICTTKGGTCRKTCSPSEKSYVTCGSNLGHCCIPIVECRLMPACDNHFGECRKQCYSFERPVAGGCGRHCTCCTSRPAVCPATHDTCAANSTLQDICTTKGGTCRKTCSPSEKSYVTCGSNLGHCCIPIVECRLMPACDNHFGECRKQCYSFERPVAGGCGRHCTCCTSRPAVCPATHDTCAANSTLQDICTTKGGTCRKTCSPSEKSYVTCGSNLGHCCIPIVENITTTAQCTGRGGMCKNMTLCPTDTLQNGRCGLTFICCFPTDKCRLMPACDNHFGECRKQCHSFERVVAGGCGRHCTCCTSRPAVCPATHDTCAGTCIDRRFCPSHFQLSGICSGDNDCVCCSSNSTLQDICTTKGGTCRKTCSPSEKSYVTCGSNLGHCCIPIVGNITTTAQCTGRGGMCKNMTLCPTDTLQNGRCGLTSICCFSTDKCRLMPACDNHFGECRKQCHSFERVVAGGCGRYCTCCTSRPAVCPATHDTCAGTCIDRRFCPSHFQLSGICSGDNDCVCCSSNSTLQDICTTKGGTCRKTCSPSEKSYVTCGSNLGHCCIPIVENITTTAQCTGRGGMCKNMTLCPTDTLQNGRCGLTSICCFSTDKCRLMPACDNHFGECRKQCHSFERVVAGGCGRYCTCCTSRPAVCPATHDTCAGTCIDRRFCPSHFQLSGICSGDNDCVCCSSNSTLQDICTTKGGTCRKTCSPSEKSYVTCGSNLGHCCIPIVENITTTAQCTGRGGMCKNMTLCPTDTLQNGRCGLTSICCFSTDKCRLMPACDNHFGECRKQCHSFERVVAGGCGRHCTCCTSRPAVCPATHDTCAGTCIDRRFCPSHFQLSGICSGDNDCVCCSSNSTLQDICTTKGGTCRKTCSPSEKSYVTCGSNLGHCCIPIVACELMSTCDDGNGECRIQCINNERVVEGGCGDTCICCTSRPKDCLTNQPTCPGTCTDTCSSDLLMTGSCSGENDCVCCNSCELMSTCDDGNGECRIQCINNERVVEGGCGDTCICCTSRPKDCLTNQNTCPGTCTDTCSSDLLMTGSCSGENDCVCCNSCELMSTCDDGNGECRIQCINNERVVEGGCGDTCICCTSRPKDCLTNQNTCPGTCTDTCSSDLLMTGSCSGENDCVCCNSCELMSTCDDGNGECRIQCINNERVVEGGCGDTCICCTSRPKDCLTNQNTCPGTCTDTCSSDLLMTGSCSGENDCVCCNSCELMSTCDDGNGECRIQCINNERVVEGGCGDTCICCTSRPKDCLTNQNTCPGTCTDTCSSDLLMTGSCSGENDCVCCNSCELMSTCDDGNGECRIQCINNERVVEGGCGDTCICCTSRPKDCLTNQNTCPGTCTDTCSSDLLMTGSCSGENDCVCCNSCDLMSTCDDGNGECRIQCINNERVVEGGCGDTCICCTSRPKDCLTNQNTCPGTCTDTCSSDLLMTGSCSGENDCVCCNSCDLMSTCDDGNGECRIQCINNERVVEGGCGDTCICCTSRPKDCLTNQNTCPGTCTDTCSSDLLMTGSCSGENDCVCCNSCELMSTCDDGNGECRIQCINNERVVEGGCGDTCICCTSRPKDCLANQNTCPGTCTDTCSSDLLMTGSCSGENDCVCCNSCELMSTCDDGNGECRIQCINNERVVEGGCGDTCICCTSRPKDCLANQNTCPGTCTDTCSSDLLMTGSCSGENDCVCCNSCELMSTCDDGNGECRIQCINNERVVEGGCGDTCTCCTSRPKDCLANQNTCPGTCTDTCSSDLLMTGSCSGENDCVCCNSCELMSTCDDGNGECRIQCINNERVVEGGCGDTCTCCTSRPKDCLANQNTCPGTCTDTCSSDLLMTGSCSGENDCVCCNSCELMSTCDDGNGECRIQCINNERVVEGGCGDTCICCTSRPKDCLTNQNTCPGTCTDTCSSDLLMTGSCSGENDCVCCNSCELMSTCDDGNGECRIQCINNERVVEGGCGDTCICCTSRPKDCLTNQPTCPGTCTDTCSSDLLMTGSCSGENDCVCCNSCELMSTCDNGNGECRIQCINNERVVEGGCGDTCICCTSRPKDCLANQNTCPGTCTDTCSSDLLMTGSCSGENDCVCCNSCELMSTCDDGNGECRIQCINNERVVEGGCGDTCICCTSRPKDCLTNQNTCPGTCTDTCSSDLLMTGSCSGENDCVCCNSCELMSTCDDGNGECRIQCINNERVVEGGCGDTCTCCTSRPKDCLTNQNTCPGTCTDTCSSDLLMTGSCSGENDCVCCNSCELMSTCDDGNGECRIQCINNERVVEGGCGDTCICCTSRPKDCLTNQNTCPGTCTDTCSSDLLMTGSCSGENDCVCCNSCELMSTCDNGNGECRIQCINNERVVEGGCGDTCICCTSRPKDCLANQNTCPGTCTDTCSSDLLMTGSCSGENDCVCCNSCELMSTCDDGNGECRIQCINNERVVEGGCGDTCICCTSRPKDCLTNQNTCPGTCTDTCSSDLLMTGSCSGENDCVCCNSCELMSTCDDGNGECRIQCINNERVVEGGCGDTCTCCTSRPKDCLTNQNTCPGTCTDTCSSDLLMTGSCSGENDCVCCNSCELMSTCDDGNGECRIQCINNERVVEGGCGDTCICCTSRPKDCLTNQNTCPGTCTDTCSSDLLMTGSCSGENDCVCCNSCELMSTCDDGNGECRIQCINNERVVEGGCGDTCTCCTSRPKDCLTNQNTCPGTCTDTCSSDLLMTGSCSGENDCVCCNSCELMSTCDDGNGECRIQCINNERVVEGGCGDTCICCTSRPKDCLTNQPTCPGTCTDTCSSDLLMTGSCSGENDCVCCNSCELMSTCDDGNGECRIQCINNERVVEGGCGDTCICCTSRPKDCLTNQNTCPGTCTDTCSSDLLMTGSCSGENDCVCCNSCELMSTCDDGNGECRIQCINNERVVEGGCGDTCICCTSRPKDCLTNQPTCPGTCTDTCSSDLLMTGSCSGENDCVCCNSCELMSTCDDGNGECRIQCINNERVVEGGCGDTCICCTSRPKDCLTNQPTCPGTCTDTCSSDLLMTGSCSGENDCVCCNSCELMSTCDDGNGECRIQCINNERVVEGGCGDTCICCTSRPKDCLTNQPTCPGTCTDTCSSDLLMTGSCSGENDCVCCNSCELMSTCDDGNGECRIQCINNERVVEGGCGDTCICCTSRPKDCLTNQNTCPGTCTDTCSSDLLMTGSCSGENDCVCCNSCELMSTCDDGNGECRIQCINNERVVEGGCGDPCICCTSRPKDCLTNQPTCPGTCTDTCSSDLLMTGSCSGENDCVCCNSCELMSTCDDGNGECRIQCINNERVVEGGCGDTCICCTSRPKDCLTNQNTCPGTCTDTCSSDLLMTGSCSGENDCVCCNSCDLMSTCDDGNGECRIQCINNERVVEGGCGDTCICCTSRPKNCLANQGTCPGTCTDTCTFPFQVLPGLCSGDSDCDCCFFVTTTTSTTTTTSDMAAVFHRSRGRE
ncbi:hypothetical protein Pmani_011665 [Petrolisthes manimaculis]|uniref:Beta/alpha-defensin C-terminal domain-containing protein n=1 Tax=Petrolisthes manimaculis TaxID=1843537 RepID=A0AAE1PZ21_9EUCA|nr:hypothetical protein Pmani_011665 [Petrolisthes manimaculis]